MYVHICTCSGSHCAHCVHDLATGLDHQGLEECVSYTTYLHILTLQLCKYGTKQHSHCTFCVTKHPVSW